MVELVTALEQAHRESPSWRLYGLCHQAATRIAELAAENERLKQAIADANADRDRWYESSFRANSRTEALSRTGAVKVLDPDMPAQEMRLHMGEMTAQEMRTARAAIRWANTRLPALEPAAPEGQQEPVAWGEFYGGKIATVRTDKSRHCTVPLYTRPAEQAVTEAMVVAATEEYFAASFKNTPSDAMRIALKAAMEAEG